MTKTMEHLNQDEMFFPEPLFCGGEYGVIVVGGGHAGCEAAAAAARLGVKTLLLTLNKDALAMLPCNPSIGGTAKGILVREVDALGGLMGVIADRAQIQMRMLNRSKGPAVQCLRGQMDKNQYHREMLAALEHYENLDIRQGEVNQLMIENGAVRGVILRTGAAFYSECVVLTTGTYLDSRVVIGNVHYPSGPSGLPPATPLGIWLRQLGLDMCRFKTGTPARVDGRTIDFSKMKEQPSDPEPLAFSFLTTEEEIATRPQISCWLSYTNEKTHEIIRANLHRSPLYSGIIEGTGPRYCPSIEDKIVRFADKDSHQTFLEPEGLDTTEWYVQGMSSSLPEDVQIAFLKTIPGLEQVRVIRPAYAIEYDCLQPTQLNHYLAHKEIKGLFTAGQINGTSGYEEAAAQGILAGINAGLFVLGKEPIAISRTQGYLGVLVDDLVTKGVMEPYRMFSSLAEHRLLLRQDNADARLTPLGQALGIVPAERWALYEKTQEEITAEQQRLETTRITPQDEKAQALITAKGDNPLQKGISAMDLLKRTNISYEDVISLIGQGAGSRVAREQVVITAKYTGYIKKQQEAIERAEKLENKRLPVGTDYRAIKGLSLEAGQKLTDLQPQNIGQAGRISGVSPADINVLLIWLEQQKRNGAAKDKQK